MADPQKIANPPILEIEHLCIRRSSRGTSIAPVLHTKKIDTGDISAVIAIAIRKIVQKFIADNSIDSSPFYARG